VGWWLGIVVYLVVVRRGNHEHDYYQMCLLPALAVGAGLGVEAWWRWIARPGRARRPRWKSWRWPQWATVALAVVSLAYAELQAYHKHKLALDSLVAGRAVAAVRQDDEKTLVYELGGLRHQQILYYTGGRGWLLPEDLKAFDDLKPYRERGARFLTVSMRTDEWAQDLYPLPQVRQWAQEGHLKEIARSGDQFDRYDRPRTWAVWRIAE
jgi:hypothetical protein